MKEVYWYVLYCKQVSSTKHLLEIFTYRKKISGILRWMLRISFKLSQWINGSVNDTEMKGEMRGVQA